MKSTSIITTAVAAALVCLLATQANAETDPVVDLFLASQYEHTSARFSGTGFAGVATLNDVSSVLLNPAIIHAYQFYTQSRISTTVSYGRGGVFSDHIASTGLGVLIAPQASCAAMYRYLQADEQRAHHEAIGALSGRLFDKSVNQGAVDYGLSVRYEKTDWELREGDFDTAFIYEIRTGPEAATESIDTAGIASKGGFEEQRILLDVGFYQRNIGDNLDFGITFHNLLGYRWRRVSPHISFRDSVAESYTDSTGDTTGSRIIHAEFYENEPEKNNSWLDSYYRRLTVGIAFRKYLLESKVRVHLPMDLEIVGLFDRSRGAHFAFRTGLELWIQDTYAFRFGFNRAPNLLAVRPPASFHTPGELHNENIFTGGAGLRIDRLSFDLYIRGIEWGIGCGLGL